MVRRGVLVARERQPADDLAVDLGDEHRRVRMACAPRAGTAARRRRRATRSRSSSPRARRSPRSRARRAPARRAGSARRIVITRPPSRRRRAAGRRPRRASRRRSTSTAFAPPKKRLRDFHCDDAPRSSSPPTSAPRLAWTTPSLDVHARRARPRRARSCPRASTLTTTCMIAPRSRALPALPTTSRVRPSSKQMLGAIIDVSRVPGRCTPARSSSPSMLLR